jgi:3'-5' exoribonuclease
MLTKKRRIDEMRAGEDVDDIFVVRSRAEGSSLVLCDSGSRTIDCFGESIRGRGVKSGSVVHVIGRAVWDGGKMRILCSSIEALKAGDFSVEGLLKPERRPVEQMRAELTDAIAKVSDGEMNALLSSVFDDAVVRERFFVYPGALEIHHAWTSGLLQHTLEVLRYSLLAGEVNGGMNRDLLITGALLHDIGKIFELSDGLTISREGSLLGHIVLGLLYVDKKCDAVRMGGEKRDRVLHVIASHYGRLSYGSPREPMFPEAFAIYYADELSSKLSRVLDFVESHRSDAEDFAYSRRDERSIYLG